MRDTESIALLYFLTDSLAMRCLDSEKIPERPGNALRAFPETPFKIGKAQMVT